MLFLLSACSEIDQDQNSEIKLKEGNVNEDLDLLRKDFEYYKQFDWDEDSSLPYVWLN